MSGLNRQRARFRRFRDRHPRLALVDGVLGTLLYAAMVASTVGIIPDAIGLPDALAWVIVAAVTLVFVAVAHSDPDDDA